MSARTRRWLRTGLPIFVTITGGCLVIVNFAEVRYKYRKHRALTKEEMKELGWDNKKPEKVETVLQEAYEQLQEVDLDNWKNIRGPREWEEWSPEYKELVEKLDAKKEEQKHNLAKKMKE